MKTAAAAATLFNAGATPIDLRDATAFDAGHVANALNVPAADVPTLPTVLLDLERETTVVLYGAGGADRDEYVAAFVLEATGFTNVVYYSGGWADWVASTE